MEKLVNPVKDTSIAHSNDNLVSDKSNINITKSYMSGHGFLVGSLLVVVMVMNILVALFMYHTLEEQNKKLNVFEKEFLEYKVETDKKITKRLDSQSDLIVSFIESRRY